MMKNLKNNYQGFTILEALVAMAGMLLLVEGAVSLFLFSNYSRDVIWEQLSTQNEGRKIVHDFTNEIRKTNYSSLGAYPIESAATSSIIFYTNLDTDNYREKVRYFLSGQILKKGVIKPSGNPLVYNPASETVLDIVHDIANGSDPIFTYYSEGFSFATGTPMVSPINVTDIRLIKINLLLEQDPNNSPVPFSIESKAEVRNLKTN